MSPSRLPVADIAQLFSTIEFAMNYCTWDGAAPNSVLWNELNASRAFVKAYLLESCPPLPVEIREAA